MKKGRKITNRNRNVTMYSYLSIESLKAFLNTLLETLGFIFSFKLFQSCAPFTSIVPAPTLV